MYTCIIISSGGAVVAGVVVAGAGVSKKRIKSLVRLASRSGARYRRNRRERGAVARVAKEYEQQERSIFNKKIGENLRDCYRGAGYNQKEFASLLGISPATLQSWVQGNKTADIFYLLKSCKILDKNIFDLLKGNNILEIDSLNLNDEDMHILKEMISERKNK